MFDTRPRPVTISSAALGRALGVALGTAIVLAILAGDTAVRAQQAPAATPAPGPAAEAPRPPFTYDAAGRRDPFVDLNRASDPRGSARGKVTGLPGLAIGDATVKGVVKSQGRLVAMLQAPDNKTYIVRPNDKLLDGAVRLVTPEAVVFVQHINDPLSPVRQREIRKPLRIVEEEK